MKKIALVIMAVAMLVSCTNYKEQKERLAEQNDSLRLESAKTAAEYEEMLSLLNEIEDNFKQMKEAENYLTVQSAGKGEIRSSAKERIKSDLQFLKSTLDKNKEDLANLQRKLKSSSTNSAQLQKRIDSLLDKIEEKTTTIASLQKELVKRDESIRTLTANVKSLEGNVAQLQETSSSLSQTIQSQDAALNTGYYVVGSAKQLKEWKVIEGGTIFKKRQMLMNKEMFSQVDIRQLKELPLNSKKAKLLTDHPASSYSLQADENKMLTLIITDAKEFWGISKYLVVQN